MHGIVMNQFRQFAIERLGREGWREVAEAAGVGGGVYEIGKLYPDEELGRLLGAAAQAAGAPVGELVEAFGTFIAPALLRVYEPLIDSAWRTLDVIEHTEEVIHTVVRARMQGADPPALDVTRVSPAEVVIDYRSPRRMCFLAKGIARGLGAHYGEEVVITEPECMHRGDARCLISVRLGRRGDWRLVPSVLPVVEEARSGLDQLLGVTCNGRGEHLTRGYVGLRDPERYSVSVA